MRTYIVRVWVETGTPGLRGTVHDVESGERRAFQTPEELVDYVTPDTTADLESADR